MDEKQVEYSFWEKPMLGTVLMVASYLSFFFLCMILSLVGPAGAKVENAGKNMLAFLAVLIVTFLLSVAATYSKVMRRKLDQSPLPYGSIGLSGLCVVILVVLLSGGFAI